MRPRLLFLAFYFPPSRASGVFRSRAIANHLAAGWDVTVVTPQREFFTDYVRSVDLSLEDTIDPSVHVERVRFPGRPWEQDLRRFGRLRGNFPPVADRLAAWGETRFFPERYSPWIPRVVARGRALHRQQPFDLILATGNPYSAFAAAWALGRVLRLPYVIDYRDSWTLDQFRETDAYPPGHPVWAWERRIVHGAARVVFVNEAQRDWYQQRYPAAKAAMRVVENGYDEDALILDDRPVPRSRVGPLEFGYIGTITEQLPLDEFLAGWTLARRDPLLSDARLRLFGHLGFFPNHVKRIMARLPLDADLGVTYEGPVDKAAISTAYDRLDALTMIIPSSKYVTAGKVYEYMAVGKPIVAVHEPWAGASEPLRGYPLKYPVADLSPDAVRDALVAAGQAADHLTVEQVAAARAYARRYTRDAQLAPLERELREVVGG
jgi:glycosyltransferase involved in cell wall biosynthesis